MRMTLDIDDDVLAAARSLAERNGSNLGSALSELARRGYEGQAMFRVPIDAQTFTSEDVDRALSDWP